MKKRFKAILPLLAVFSVFLLSGCLLQDNFRPFKSPDEALDIADKVLAQCDEVEDDSEKSSCYAEAVETLLNRGYMMSISEEGRVKLVEGAEAICSRFDKAISDKTFLTECYDALDHYYVLEANSFGEPGPALEWCDRIHSNWSRDGCYGTVVRKLLPRDTPVAISDLPAQENSLEALQRASEICDRFEETLSEDESYYAAICHNEAEAYFGCLKTDKFSESEILDVLPNLRSVTLICKSPIDLSKISHLTNLKKLSLYYTPVSDISPLSNLANLKSLELWELPVSDISPLSNLTELEELNLHQLPVSDISPLSNLTKLIEIRIYRLPFSDASPLSNLNNLYWLDLKSTSISNTSPLSNLTNLKHLSLEGSPVSDISSLSSLTKLTSLHLGSTQVSDVSSLSKLTKLDFLMLYETRVSDLSPLSSLTSLSSFSFHSTSISDISPLSNLTKLYTLDLSDTHVSDLSPLGNLKNLSSLRAANIPASNISALNNLTGLHTLDLTGTPVSDLTPISNLSLGQFYFDGKALYNTNCKTLQANWPNLVKECE